MVHYRRDLTPGSTYFFTLALRNRKSKLLTSHITELGNAFRYVKKKYPFTMDAIVVLPDHLHAIWTLPDNDCNYSIRWHQVKAYFTKCLINNGQNIKPDKRGEYHLWQRRFWEHRIRDEADLHSHIDYIHFNPVKHRLVTSVKEWPFSSFYNYVRGKILSEDWGGIDIGVNFGES